MTIRKDILNDLQKWLSGISIASGYLSDVQTVKRGIFWENDMNERPALTFWNDKYNRTNLLGGCSERKLHIFLWGYTDITEPGNFDAMDNLIFDIENCIENNRAEWNPVIDEIDIGDSTIYEAGHESSIGCFEMELEITYREG